MIVTIDVQFPKKSLSAEQKKVISEILNQSDVQPDFYNGIKYPKMRV